MKLQSREAPAVGGNLKRLRIARQLTLEALAAECGVSRAMLGQIELEKSIPTINVLGKNAKGLGVSIEEVLIPTTRTDPMVLHKRATRLLVDADGGRIVRSLVPSGSLGTFDFEEVRLAAGPFVQRESVPSGATLSILVAVGRIELVAGAPYVLDAGDCIELTGGVSYSVRNDGSAEVITYVLLQHARKV
jgi:transcriptional regulator with XRE-family HTH domain